MLLRSVCYMYNSKILQLFLGDAVKYSVTIHDVINVCYFRCLLQVCVHFDS